MLVVRRGGALHLITQPDHAALAGELAGSWGNDEFAAPAPRAALLCAATHHDDGWLALDGRPAYDAQERRPAHFTELPLEVTVEPYGRGVESVYARDPHAGALVSMHFSGFYTGRWGVGGFSPSPDPLAQQVVAHQEARWMPALRQAWGNQGLRSQFDAQNWHAYEVLQAVDLCSLALGLMNPYPAEGEPAALDMARTLTAIDQSPGPRTVTTVPRAAGGPWETLTLTAVATERFRVSPSPFHDDPLTLTVPERILEDRAYASARELAAAYHAAPMSQRLLTLVG